MKLEHMPQEHQRYLTYNEDDFKTWAMSVGPMTEKAVYHFLDSGKAPEQGYKACASLKKLSNRYGRKRLENACGRVLAFTTTPSVRNISSLLKNERTLPDNPQPEQPKTSIVTALRAALLTSRRAVSRNEPADDRHAYRDENDRHGS